MIFIDFRERLIHIHQFRYATWKRISNMLRYDPTLQKIFRLSPEQLSPFFSQHSQAISFYQHLHQIDFNYYKTLYETNEINIVTIFDKEYPKELKEIFDSPWILYTKGNKSILNKHKKMSIVGTRKPSSYGIECVDFLTKQLVHYNWTIVSGLAIGIDAKSHEVALQEKGTTIAVLGSGFKHIYPKDNVKLAKQMMLENLLVTEYPYETTPNKWQFPERNRIISGLSSGTIIIEAKERSGSLITAYQALEQGREVFCVPGSIFNENSKGTNKLIQEGAKLIKSYDDISEELIIK